MIGCHLPHIFGHLLLSYFCLALLTISFIGSRADCVLTLAAVATTPFLCHACSVNMPPYVPEKGAKLILPVRAGHQEGSPYSGTLLPTCAASAQRCVDGHMAVAWAPTCQPACQPRFFHVPGWDLLPSCLGIWLSHLSSYINASMARARARPPGDHTTYMLCLLLPIRGRQDLLPYRHFFYYLLVGWCSSILSYLLALLYAVFLHATALPLYIPTCQRRLHYVPSVIVDLFRASPYWWCSFNKIRTKLTYESQNLAFSSYLLCASLHTAHSL